MSDTLEWIAVDWGTSNLRVWMMAADGTVLAERVGDQGMGALTPDAFEPALLSLIGDRLPATKVTPVLCCGMVGARQGWIEAPYAAAPCNIPGAAQAVTAPTQDPRIRVTILPGVMQRQPADVMRGEETQIGGFLAAEPGFDGVLCLPGTHTKWAHISAEEIVSFRTFLTGELFALLSDQSVLRHSLGGTGWDDVAFAEAVNDAISAPQHLSARLFSLRADTLVNEMDAGTGRARLSGWLIGLELAGARGYWLGQEVVLIGGAGLAGLYETALLAQGAMVRRTDASALTRAGLSAAYASMTGTKP